MTGLHCCLQPGKHSEGSRIALASTGRSLDEQHWRRAVTADERALADLEIIEMPGLMESVQPGHELQLPRRAAAVARSWGMNQSVIEGVWLPVAQALDHLAAPVAVPVVGAQ